MQVHFQGRSFFKQQTAILLWLWFSEANDWKECSKQKQMTPEKVTTLPPVWLTFGQDRCGMCQNVTWRKTSWAAAAGPTHLPSGRRDRSTAWTQSPPSTTQTGWSRMAPRTPPPTAKSPLPTPLPSPPWCQQVYCLILQICLAPSPVFCPRKHLELDQDDLCWLLHIHHLHHHKSWLNAAWNHSYQEACVWHHSHEDNFLNNWHYHCCHLLLQRHHHVIVPSLPHLHWLLFSPHRCAWLTCANNHQLYHHCWMCGSDDLNCQWRWQHLCGQCAGWAAGHAEWWRRVAWSGAASAAASPASGWSHMPQTAAAASGTAWTHRQTTTWHQYHIQQADHSMIPKPHTAGRPQHDTNTTYSRQTTAWHQYHIKQVDHNMTPMPGTADRPQHDTNTAYSRQTTAWHQYHIQQVDHNMTPMPGTADHNMTPMPGTADRPQHDTNTTYSRQITAWHQYHIQQVDHNMTPMPGTADRPQHDTNTRYSRLTTTWHQYQVQQADHNMTPIPHTAGRPQHDTNTTYSRYTTTWHQYQVEKADHNMTPIPGTAGRPQHDTNATYSRQTTPWHQYHIQQAGHNITPISGWLHETNTRYSRQTSTWHQYQAQPEHTGR